MDGAARGLRQAAELACVRGVPSESAEAEYDLLGGARARPPSPWDEPDAVRLGLALRRLGRFDMSSPGGRLAFQNSVYLLQAFGVYLGYPFSWYLRGPYSSRLARHGLALERAYGLLPDTGLHVDRPAEARFARFLEFMDGRRDEPARLEALASVHFMRRLCGDLGDRDIAARVMQRQPYLGADTCRQSLDELRSEGLAQTAGQGAQDARPLLPRRRRPRRRMLRGSAGETGREELPATDEGKAAYCMIADAQGMHPEAVAIYAVSGRVFDGQEIYRPTLTEGEIETLEILSDPDAVRELEQAERDKREGRVVAWRG